MKEYVLLFRIDIATESELADGGNHFSKAGKLLGPRNTIIDGPYTANKQSVAGYIIILAKDMDDAISMAAKCPILEGEGTSVKIRETATPG